VGVESLESIVSSGCSVLSTRKTPEQHGLLGAKWILKTQTPCFEGVTVGVGPAGKSGDASMETVAGGAVAGLVARFLWIRTTL
jgi:hypothetical protein